LLDNNYIKSRTSFLFSASYRSWKGA